MIDAEPDTLPRCADKLAFDTQKQARTAAIVADHQHGTQLKTYKCKVCHLWHLATKYVV